MTMQPSPDLLDLAEAVAAGALQADDAERQLRLALGSDRAAESEQAVRELRGLVGAAGAVRAHARATREAFGSASPPTPASIATLVPGRVAGGAVHRRSSNGGDGAGRAPRRTWLLAAAALLLVGGAMAAGSGLARLSSVVPPVPAPTLPAAVTNPTAEPGRSPTVAPSPAPTETPAVVPPRAASWTATGSMIKPRSDHTATLLRDGKVLVAGGQEGDHPDSMASAELYEPGRRTWIATGSMGTPRSGHRATLLLDGKVLVTGGVMDPSGTRVASAELYDPSTGTWTATGSMGTPRSDHTATLLPDGKVLVTGGVNSLRVVDGISASAELYDPATGAWTAAGNMATPRYEHAAALLPDGKVLVAGGADSGAPDVSALLDSAELYDPGSGTWSATGTMVTLYNNQSAAALADGGVLVGGYPPELYDPLAASWTAIGSKVIAGWYGPAVLLTDGRVFVLGAGTPGQDVSPDTAAAIFDPVTGSWTAVGKLGRQRFNFTYTATLLPDGDILVVGGSAPSPATTYLVSMASAELYDPGSR